MMREGDEGRQRGKEEEEEKMKKRGERQ